MSQIKHSISAHCVFPLCENLWFPQPLMEKCQKKLLDSLVNMPVPRWRHHHAHSLPCSIGLPSISTQNEMGMVMVNWEPATQFQWEGLKLTVKSCIILFAHWGMQWSHQGHGECHPSSGKKNWSSYILGDREGASVVYLSTKERWTIVDGVPFCRPPFSWCPPTPPPDMDIVSS